MHEQHVAARAVLAADHPQARPGEVADRAERKRIARYHQQPLLAPGPCDADMRAHAQHLTRCGGVEGATVRVQQVHRRGNRLACRERLQPFEAATAAKGQAAARLAHRPIQQGVVAAGQHRRRLHTMRCVRPLGTRREPTCQQHAREHPLPRRAGRRAPAACGPGRTARAPTGAARRRLPSAS